MSDTTLKSTSAQKFKIFGLPPYIFAIFGVVVLAGVWSGSMSTDLIGSFALLFFLGIVFGEIGDRIPIWNEYIGGGPILAFLGSAYLVYANILPEKYVDGVNVFMDDSDFLVLFVTILITGSILSVNRKLLIRSFLGYIPSILGGVAAAFLFGGLAGMLMGIPMNEVAIKYVLPIMGGGNGAGAIPLSEIYAQVTGESQESYYSFAISILTIGNIFAIFFGAMLNKLGKMRPELTGDGENLLKNADSFFDEEEEEEVEVTNRDIVTGIILAGTFYTLGRFFAKFLLPTIGGIVIHQFAYMVVFVAIANVMGLIPKSLTAGAKKLQKFFTGQFILVMMAGVGIAFTDLGELIAAITPQNMFIAFFIVFGAVVGSMVVGHLVGFFAVDTAVTAGLCMANRGGSGDIQVLGAAKRMELIPYAQISSRLGGGMILVIASIIFGIIA